MNFAGENINAGFHLFDYGDSLVIPKSLVKERKSRYVINPIYRFAKFFFSLTICSQIL